MGLPHCDKYESTTFIISLGFRPTRIMSTVGVDIPADYRFQSYQNPVNFKQLTFFLTVTVDTVVFKATSEIETNIFSSHFVSLYFGSNWFDCELHQALLKTPRLNPSKPPLPN